jgi:tetratricopeptide (TPR) repeat protein
MYLSWLAIIDGDTNSFYDYQSAINTNGSSLVGSDKEAQNQFTNKTIPNVDLLKARLLFDGGYFEKSLTILHEITFSNNSEFFIESIYRKAVNQENLGMTENAKQNFLLAFEFGRLKTAYYGAKSALHLGRIFQKEGNVLKSKEYYQKCIDLKNHEYEQSLEQKAKTGLNSLRTSNP